MRERFISPEQPPEGIERELLTILAEECAEVTQRASKALRFGTLEVQPGQPFTNVQRLSHEIGDLLVVIDMLEERGLLERDAIEQGRNSKAAQLAKFLQATGDHHG